MKLRIKGNTIRFRLTRPEVELFGKEGYIEEQTDFLPRPFIYKLKTDNSILELSASFNDNGITVFIPENFVKEWISSEQVGFEGLMKTEKDVSVYILVEKDFKCLDATGEDQSENYENPLQANHE